LDRLLYAGGALTAFLAVALGAFAAHALRTSLAPEMLAIFETGARYQMYHALALFAAAWGWARWRTRAFSAAGLLFGIGIALFCGSLYVLAVTGIRAFGMVTPLGGVAFLGGWLCLAAGAWRART
jgi:uncharacterized membrane protein YgdD (TMEM256/DUF423 family)